MDVARILLTPVDLLKKTDITENALSILAQSNVKNVYLIGRRGPLQAAFTIKELREQLKMANCKTFWRVEDFQNINDYLEKLQRPRKRLTELMLKSLSEMQPNLSSNVRNFLPVFHRSPLKFLTTDVGRLIGLEMNINRLIGLDVSSQQCQATGQREILNCDLILRSIGYKSIQVDPDINFDTVNGCVPNVAGRVLVRKNFDQAGSSKEDTIDPGLYVTGWLRTGPMGVILTTMSNAFEVAESVGEDLQNDHIDVKKEGFSAIREHLDRNSVPIVDWNGWLKIDNYEVEQGKKNGRPREKLCDIKKMLEITC
jgi:adrenodoxin-NADP+ reductase